MCRLKIILSKCKEMNQSLEDVVSITEESSAGIEQTSASVQESASTIDEIVRNSESVDHFKLR